MGIDVDALFSITRCKFCARYYLPSTGHRCHVTFVAHIDREDDHGVAIRLIMTAHPSGEKVVVAKGVRKTVDFQTELEHGWETLKLKCLEMLQEYVRTPA